MKKKHRKLHKTRHDISSSIKLCRVWYNNYKHNQQPCYCSHRTEVCNLGDHFNHFPSELYGPVSLKTVPAAVKGADDLYCSKMRSSDLIWHQIQFPSQQKRDRCLCGITFTQIWWYNNTSYSAVGSSCPRAWWSVAASAQEAQPSSQTQQTQSAYPRKKRQKEALNQWA